MGSRPPKARPKNKTPSPLGELALPLVLVLVLSAGIALIVFGLS